jgi:hypothetical protein
MTYSEAYNEAREKSFKHTDVAFYLVCLSGPNEKEEWNVTRFINMLHPLFKNRYAIFHSGKMIFSTWM